MRGQLDEANSDVFAKHCRICWLQWELHLLKKVLFINSRNKDDISSDLSDFNDNDDNLSDLSDLDANQDHHGAPAEDHDHGHDPGHNHGQDHDREVSSGNGPTRRLDTDGAGSSNSAPSDRKLSPKKKKKKKKKSDESEEINQSELDETKVY